MRIISKMKLMLNWKSNGVRYSFEPNVEYEVSEAVYRYLTFKYGDKFELKELKREIIEGKLEEEKVVEEKVDNLRNYFTKPNMKTDEILWTIGIVNYKSLSFMEYQLKSLYYFNSLPFKLIIVDNSIPSEMQKLKKLCKGYANVTIIKSNSKEIPTSSQHSEGLSKILDIVDTKYLLINDPDFFWVQKEYLYTLQKIFEEGYVCVGAPWFTANPELKDTTPALWGCAYDTKILEKSDFYSHEGESKEKIFKMVSEGKDTGWKLREKFKRENLKTFSFGDKFGISIPNEFDQGIKHFSTNMYDSKIGTTAKDIHEYSYNGKIIAYHLQHGCHETESSFPSLGQRRKAPAICGWTNVRNKYKDFFYNILSKEKEIKPLEIHLHFPVKNEERILPYFFKHYDKYVTKYFAYYNIHSTDETLEILKSKPSVTIIPKKNTQVDDRIYRDIKNYEWREHSTVKNCDWVIICDSDEFLYHPDLLGLLNSYDEKRINLPKVKGYQMFAEFFPIDKEKQIYDIIKNGIKKEAYNKYVLMKPDVWPEFSYGAHFMCPGSLKGITFSDDLEINNVEKAKLKLLHFAIFGDDFIDKMFERQKNMSEFNLTFGFGIYNLNEGSIWNPEQECITIRNTNDKVI